MSSMHASEIARTFHDAVVLAPTDDALPAPTTAVEALERFYARRRTPPGSLEEHEALRAIEQRRYEEINPPSSRALKRRARRHWSEREHALGH